MTQLKNKEKGDYGEKVAAFFLEKHGYTIIKKNYHSALGEVDLIAKSEKNEWKMIEVKFRTNKAMGGLEASISEKKLKKIEYAANDYFLREKALEEIPNYQIEVIWVEQITVSQTNSRGNLKITHWKNIY